ncbi:MAG: flagellar protein FlgN [Lachnospiraceae bacterium]|nr:flagellar protein FlgN [Lachnospiraceae bacterium]
MEELIICLETDEKEFERLLTLSQQKTPVIVNNKIAELEKITDEEQIIVSRISNLETRRESVTKDIAEVINKDVAELKLTTLIDLMSNQPGERKRLSDIHDKLSATVKQIRQVNEGNAELIKNALEMVNFDLSVVQAMRQAPETANYSRGAVNTGSMLGGSAGGFDAKQ